MHLLPECHRAAVSGAMDLLQTAGAAAGGRADHRVEDTTRTFPKKQARQLFKTYRACSYTAEVIRTIPGLETANKAPLPLV
jgi:hypothetical protein